MYWKIAAHLSLSLKLKSVTVPTHTTRCVSQACLCASLSVLCIIFKNTANIIDGVYLITYFNLHFFFITELEYFTHFLFILLLMTYMMPSIF